jgi:hypothetical protein
LKLGREVIPVILREVENGQDWWFDALRSLTGENPARDAKTFEEAARLWFPGGNRIIFSDEMVVS